MFAARGARCKLEMYNRFFTAYRGVNAPPARAGPGRAILESRRHARVGFYITCMAMMPALVLFALLPGRAAAVGPAAGFQPRAFEPVWLAMGGIDAYYNMYSI